MWRVIRFPLLILIVGGFWTGQIHIPSAVLTWAAWIIGFFIVTVAVGKGMLGGRRR